MADVPLPQNDVQANKGNNGWAVDNAVANKLQQDANQHLSFATKTERVAEVTALGVVNAVPGAFHAIEHDLDPRNWKETAVKVASAAAMGVAMRALLPEAGAVKAIVGTAMGVYFAKDAFMPIVHGWGNVTRDGSSQAMDQSTRSIGDALGAFAVDGYISAKIAGYAGDMTPRLAEKYIPEQWNALESWKAQTYGAGSPLGLRLGSLSAAVEAKARQWGDKLDPPKPVSEFSPVSPKNMTREELLQAIATSEKDNLARAHSINIYKNGMQGSDGLNHGLDGTFDLLMQGLDPRKVAAQTDDIGAMASDPNVVSLGQLKGWTRTKDIMIAPDGAAQGSLLRVAEGQGLDLKGETGRAQGLVGDADAPLGDDAAAVKGKRGGGKPSGKPASDAPASTDAPPTGGDTTPTTDAQRILNSKTMTSLAGVIRAHLQGSPDQSGLVQDAINRPTEAVHTATNANFRPLDPAYMDARNAMMALANEIGDDPKALGQVYDLFNRFGDAAAQATTGDLGPTQLLANQLNVYARENHTTYGRNIQQALGTNDISDVVGSKKPPLFEISSDLEQTGVKDGKPVFAHEGPHTVRAIYGPNGEEVWPIDLIKHPIREVGLRAVQTSPIYGHEEMHDQFGSLGRFDPAVREAKLGSAADKVLGKDAGKMIDLPGKGKPVLGEDGSPVSELPPLPAQITQKDLFINLAKAWADETFADWGAASESGQSAAPYFQALRKSGLLMNGTVMGEDMRSSSNPLGIEAHPVDTLRPHIQALLIRALAGGKDQRLMDAADALDAYAKSVSPPGDTITLASTDHVGETLSFSKKAYLDFMGQVVQDQLHTPLPRLKGHTLFEILPDLRKNMAKTDLMADSWTNAIKNNADPSTVPFDKTTTKMTHVFAAGQPAFLRLVADGMDPMKALDSVTKFSDYFRAKYVDGDPHVDPVNGTTFTKALSLTPVHAIARIPDMVTRGVGNGIRNQDMLREWFAKQAVPVSGMGGAQLFQDLIGMKKTQDEVLNGAANKKGS